MIAAWSPEQVRAAEDALMATLPGGELMARAVEGLTAVAAARLEERGGSVVLALVGPGNNGADALYAAARLAEAGRTAYALVTDRVHEGARVAAEAAGVTVLCPPPFGAQLPNWEDVDGPGGEDLPNWEGVERADLVLDGILGIGGRPGLPDWARAWVAAVPDPAYVLAVDLPSGQDPHGLVLDPDGVFADETVTFSVAKPVHLLPATEPAVGLLTVVDIGLVVDEEPAVARLDHDDVAGVWPVPTAADDKYSRGVLGIIAGGEDYTGAAVLACTAAVTAGVGMVRYVGTPTPTALVRAAVPEAVHGVGRVQAWVVGPGLDPASRAKGAKAQLDAARAALASDDTVLVDAGGLELLAKPRTAPTLLTPHAGECARLLTRLTDTAVERADVEADPLGHARRLAEVTGATVLLKGSTTIVVSADPARPVWSQHDAPAWLATAGAGDVLAGLAGTLLAAGLDPAVAGAVAALVHGVAADTANPDGPVRALAVAHALGPTVARLCRRG